MNPTIDPFAYHPELRGKIVPPLDSPMRHFNLTVLEAKTRELGLPQNWWRTDESREALRQKTMAPRRDTDLWVFGYGSLMWDPAICFTEVRQAHIADYERRFILKDIYGARGTMDVPGLMVALDKGSGCDGLLFRIACANIEEETKILWHREMVAPAYQARFVDIIAGDETINALTFVADHDADLIDASLSRQDQLHYLATGTGFMGTSMEYLVNIEQKLIQLGISDEDVLSLRQDADAYLASMI